MSVGAALAADFHVANLLSRPFWNSEKRAHQRAVKINQEIKYATGLEFQAEGQLMLRGMYRAVELGESRPIIRAKTRGAAAALEILEEHFGAGVFYRERGFTIYLPEDRMDYIRAAVEKNGGNMQHLDLRTKIYEASRQAALISSQQAQPETLDIRAG